MDTVVNLSMEELQSYYLRKPFLKKIYDYYIHQGYYNIISEQFVYIINNSFVLFYTLFLMKCVDWNGLFRINSEAYFIDYIEFGNMFKLNIYNFILVIIYFIYLAIKIGYLVASIYKYKYIKHFYNNILNINDFDLVNYKWDRIIDIFHSTHENNDINVYYINNKITIQDNYFISLIDKEILNLEHLCPLMEWNIRYCFIKSIFLKDYKFDRNFIYLNSTYINSIKSKLFTISVLNFISMPILLPFMCLRNLFKYGEKFYNNPSLVTSKHWSSIAKWKYRNYNELHHEFQEKLLKSYPIANDYNNLFPIKIFGTLSGLFIFILSSLFIILIGLSIINERVLTNLYIVKSKNTLWFVGILATLITLFKKLVTDTIFYNSDDKLMELKKVINCINESTIKNKKHRDFFFKRYQYHASTFIKDIYYTLTTPFELFKLYYRTYEILKYMSDITIDDPTLGHTNMYSIIKKTNSDDMKSNYSKETFFKNNANYDYN